MTRLCAALVFSSFGIPCLETRTFNLELLGKGYGLPTLCTSVTTLNPANN